MNDVDGALITQRIISGQAGYQGEIAAYDRYTTGESLIEEFWWGDLAQPINNTLLDIADSGWVWVRFWLREIDVVLDRIFDESMALVGTHIDVTTPILVGERMWQTLDLLLDIWLWPDGRVTLLREDHFDASNQAGLMLEGDAERAEHHVRDITRWIATGEFPPVWVAQYRPEPPAQSSSA